MGTESVQMVLENDIIVPDIKPDMDYIVSCNAKAYIKDENVYDGRISFKGTADIQIVYYSQYDGKLCDLKAMVPFEDFINAEVLSSGDFVYLTPMIENVECRMLNSRKAYVKCIMSVKADMYKRKEQEVANSVSCEEKMYINTAEMSVKETVATADKSIKIAEELSIPSSKAAVEDVLYTDAYVVSAEMKPVSDGIKAMGRIRLDMMYTPDAEGTMAETVTFEVPFDGFIDVAGAENSDYVCGNIFIRNFSADVFTDNEGNDKAVSCDGC